ncbi:hypothetical protein LCGC14_2957900, partial [marine sediment metagenome]
MLDAANSNDVAVENLLEVNNIEVIYNHVILVLKGVSLNVPKGGITALTKNLSVELAADNIRINAVAPGVVDCVVADQMSDAGQLQRRGVAAHIVDVMEMAVDQRVAAPGHHHTAAGGEGDLAVANDVGRSGDHDARLLAQAGDSLAAARVRRIHHTHTFDQAVLGTGQVEGGRANMQALDGD